MIYKLMRDEEYISFVIDGETNGSPDDIRDGFIHFSTVEQLEGTLAKHFKGEAPLHLLEVDESTLSGLKWEVSRGGAEFPHLYGSLRFDDVNRQWEIDESGRLPKELA